MEWWRWTLVAGDLVLAVMLFRWLSRSSRRRQEKSYARADWEQEQRESRERRRGTP